MHTSCDNTPTYASPSSPPDDDANDDDNDDDDDDDDNDGDDDHQYVQIAYAGVEYACVRCCTCASERIIKTESTANRKELSTTHATEPTAH